MFNDGGREDIKKTPLTVSAVFFFCGPCGDRTHDLRIKSKSVTPSGAPTPPAAPDVTPHQSKAATPTALPHSGQAAPTAPPPHGTAAPTAPTHSGQAAPADVDGSSEAQRTGDQPHAADADEPLPKDRPVSKRGDATVVRGADLGPNRGAITTQGTKPGPHRGGPDTVWGTQPAPAPGGGGAAALDSKKSYCCKNSLPAGLHVGYSERRRRRWRARGALWRASSRAGVRACGRLPRQGKPGDTSDGRSRGDMIGLIAPSNNRPAGLRGLNRCANVWSCPRCSSQIALERSREIAGAIRWAHDHGGHAALLTLTVRHTGSDSLEDVWSAVSTGWREITGGYGWVGRKARHQKTAGKEYVYPAEPGDRHQFAIAGTIRNTEVTWGDPTSGGSGWHVHLHVLVVFAEDPAMAINSHALAEICSGPQPPQFQRTCALAALGIRIYERWAKGVTKAGMSTSWQGFDLREITDEGASFIGNYLTKQTYDVAAKLGAEVGCGINTKDSRSVTNVTPFGLLDELVQSGTKFWWQRPKENELFWEEHVLYVADTQTGEYHE